MRWLLLCLLLLFLPAGAEPVTQEWVAQPKLGWVHQLGVSLVVPGNPKVNCDPDGALHVETDEYLVQIFAYTDETVARQKVTDLITETEAEKSFAGLKFGEVQQYAQADGRKAYLQEGLTQGFGFILARINQGKFHVVVYSIMSTKEAQDATLALMTGLKFP
jgi:hypothetical protein